MFLYSEFFGVWSFPFFLQLHLSGRVWRCLWVLNCEAQFNLHCFVICQPLSLLLQGITSVIPVSPHKYSDKKFFLNLLNIFSLLYTSISSSKTFNIWQQNKPTNQSTRNRHSCVLLFSSSNVHFNIITRLEGQRERGWNALKC